jgi:4-hydroxybenzoate polyprenyltransferase
VSRTKNRPIASGKITNKEAIAVLGALLSLSLAILLSLNKTSIYLGFIAIILIAIYPLMKRYTYFPQAFLGITFNIGCLIGYSAIKDNISIDAILLYVACGFWTMGYDTIYAFMDIDDDKKIGVKSTAIFFENSNVKLIIALFYIIFLALFTIVFIENISFYNIVAIALISSTIYWIIAYLDIKDTENCMSRFKINNYIGFILFLAMLLEKL